MPSIELAVKDNLIILRKSSSSTFLPCFFNLVVAALIASSKRCNASG